MRAALSTLTTRGRAFLVAGVAASFGGILVDERDLVRVGLLLVVWAVTTALLANRSRYLLSSSRDITPARVQAGQTATITLGLENPGRVPTGLILLEDHVPYPLGSRPRFVIDQLRPKWHRNLSYTVRSEVRGRYPVGPLSVRLTDPFGFVELTRSFTSSSSLVVTPVVHALPAVPLTGDWSGAGDNRPRAFAAAGTEDVTVREYRTGDDLRRIHWGLTARADSLMVRREEQPHQSRATVLLDSRTVAHRGTGVASSFEYAVSVCASVGSHLAAKGFTVRMFTEESSRTDATWHDRGISGPVEVQLLLDALAIVQTGQRSTLTTPPEQGPSGLVIAILGSLTPADVAALTRLQAGSTRALAIVLDVDAWATGGPADADPRTHAVPAQAASLRHQGWSVAVAGPGDSVALLWSELANTVSLRRDFAAEARAHQVDTEGDPAA